MEKVICSFGTGTRYVLSEGTLEKCEAYIADLPSEEDEGWEDAALGTNPYQEACHIEETNDGLVAR